MRYLSSISTALKGLVPCYPQTIHLSCVITTAFENTSLGNLGADVKSIETELQLSLDCNRAGGVLRCWEQQKAVFRRLCAITRKVFCVPATTVGVERLFSIAGFSS